MPYTLPVSTVTLGNVATYSRIPALESGLGVIVKGLNPSVFRNFTFDASPLFTVAIATTSPLVLSTPNTVKITLNTSAAFPVSA